MKNERLATFCLELLLLGIGLSCYLSLQELLSRPSPEPQPAQAITITLEGEIRMTRRTTTWTSALGGESVTTTKGEFDPDETSPEWAARHRAEVIAAQLLDPPI